MAAASHISDCKTHTQLSHDTAEDWKRSLGGSTTPEGRDHAFIWTEAGGMVDLDPTGLDDGAARFVTEDRGLIIGSIFAETGQRVFAWTKTTGLTDIFTLGRDMLPEYMNRQGALTGTVFREDGTSGAFFWSQANGLVDIGTLGDDFSWASDINSPGLVAGYSKIAGGDERAIAWSADGGLIDLGTLAGSRTGASSSPRLERSSASAASKSTGRTRSCGPRPTGWSRCPRWVGSRTWTRRASVLGLILMARISARSDRASAQFRGHTDFQGYWMGVDPVDGCDAVEHAQHQVLQQRRDGQVAPQVRAGRARPDDRDRDLAGRQPGEHDRAAQGEHELDPQSGVRSQKLRTQCIGSFAFSPADAIYSN
jgi:probable HAF family extracellular repeat protein